MALEVTGSDTYFTADADEDQVHVSYQVRNGDAEFATGDHKNTIGIFRDGDEIGRQTTHHADALYPGDVYQDTAVVGVNAPINTGDRIEIFITLDADNNGNVDYQTWCIAVSAKDGPQ